MLAMDRSLRSYDKDGRLHVAVCNLSKATVNPYQGVTIPNYEALGLDPDRIYRLLRCPDELAKAAPTFNNLPILRRHIPVTAEAPSSEDVVGTTGSEAAFDGKYLTNSTAYWVADSIRRIEANEQKEHSAAYYYDADMTPGVYEGLQYDGIMRNIVGNHVALVREGRAGPDVVVADSKLEIYGMARSKYALMASGAVLALVSPKLAMDAKLDMDALFKDVKTKADRDKVPARLAAMTKGKLAQDATLDDVTDLLDKLEDIAEGEEEPIAVDADETDLAAKVLGYLKGKISDEDLAELATMVGAGATDETDEPEDEKPFDKGAMDTAIRNAKAEAIAHINALTAAKEDVAPLVGKITVAMDSADDVYRFALGQKGIKLEGTHTTDGLRTMVRMAVDAATPARRQVIAQDSADEAGFYERNPNAARLVRA